MAFSTLAQLRAKLNSDLGLATDQNGSTFAPTLGGQQADRNYAIQTALSRLWPTMARLMIETIQIATNQTDYVLDQIRHVSTIDVLDSTSLRVVSPASKFRMLWDESTIPPTPRLRVEPARQAQMFQLRVIGYAPYLAVLPSDVTPTTLPSELDWIVVHGARAEMYRRALNRRANFERFQNENRETNVTVAELMGIYNLARAEFEAAVDANGREFTTGKYAGAPPR